MNLWVNLCSFNYSRSLGSDSVFLRNVDEQDECLDTEDEVSGFSTDSEAPGPSCRRFLRIPSKRKRTVEKWDGCAGCVPRRRPGGKPCQTCRSISAAVETSRHVSTNNLNHLSTIYGFPFNYLHKSIKISRSCIFRYTRSSWTNYLSGFPRSLHGFIGNICL